MKFLEKDLEEIIYETYNDNPLELSKRKLHINGVMKRQLRIGNYGIADLVTFDRDYYYVYDPNRDLKEYPNDDETFYCTVYPKLVITVYELKKDKIGISAYLQAIKYIKGIKEYLSFRNVDFYYEFNIVLIGKELDTSGSFCFIPSISENVDFYTYYYDVDGLKFSNCNSYHLTNNGFKI